MGSCACNMILTTLAFLSFLAFLCFLTLLAVLATITTQCANRSVSWCEGEGSHQNMVTVVTQDRPPTPSSSFQTVSESSDDPEVVADAVASASLAVVTVQEGENIEDLEKITGKRKYPTRLSRSKKSKLE